MFCQNGTTIAPNRCSTAIQGLFRPDDTCSNVARQIEASGGNASLVDMSDIACLVRLSEFSSSCSRVFGNQSTVFPDKCSAAILELFGHSDTCSNVAQQIIANGGDASTVDMSDPACLIRLAQFASSCNTSSLTLTQYQMAIVQVFTPNDNCSNAFPVLPTNPNDRISFEMANVALNPVCGTSGCID